MVYEELNCGKGWLLRPYDSEHYITIYLSDEGLIADIWGLDVEGDEYVMDETEIDYWNLFFVDTLKPERDLGTDADELVKSHELENDFDYERLIHAYGVGVGIYAAEHGRDGVVPYIDIGGEEISFAQLDKLPHSLDELSKQVALIINKSLDKKD